MPFCRPAPASTRARIAALIEERRAAKARGDYARSDAIRSDLAGQGVVLKDTAQGTTWVKG